MSHRQSLQYLECLALIIVRENHRFTASLQRFNFIENIYHFFSGFAIYRAQQFINTNGRSDHPKGTGHTDALIDRARRSQVSKPLFP